MILNSTEARLLMDQIYMLSTFKMFKTKDAAEFVGLTSQDAGIVINR